MTQTTTKSKLNLDGILARMADSGEPTNKQISTWHSYRVQTLQDGIWVHPTYLPIYKAKTEAFKACIMGFPLGQARVVLLKFHHETLMEECETPQKEFLAECVKYGKI